MKLIIIYNLVIKFEQTSFYKSFRIIMIDTRFILFIMNDLLFASPEKKAIIKKLKENSEKGIDVDTLIFELEMEKIYHKIDLIKEVYNMIKSGEIILKEIRIEDGYIMEVLKINYDN